MLNRLLLALVLISLLLGSSITFAKQTLKIGVGNFPPYFIEKEQGGLFIEITQALFNELPEYDISFVFMSNNRLHHEINTGKMIDVACNIFAESKVNAFLSAPIFRYSDVAVSRKSDHLTINQLSDLQGKSITAYQGAMNLLGADYKAMATTNPKYSEHPRPSYSSYLLIAGQKEVRIGDINIFWYDLANKYQKIDEKINTQDYTVHHLWPDMYSHIAFKDENIRDAINKAITKLDHDGSIQKIYDKYRFINYNQ
ncbi:MAG: hypothetical protein COB83_06150 [Gammaproteobacteria bacterium]|nr:MAG: hypothetical protein COB83_06150 [Gammaproteobacteria bacterium]